MKLPFIILPRVTYETLVEQQREDRKTIKRLMRTVTHMKVSGGTVQHAMAGMRLTPREPTAFEKRVEAIISRNKYAQSRPHIAASLRSFAELEQRRDPRSMTDDEIFERLENWSRVGERKENEDDDVIAIVVSA